MNSVALARRLAVVIAIVIVGGGCAHVSSGIQGDLRYVGGPAPGLPGGPESGRVVAYAQDDNAAGSTEFGEERFSLSLKPGTYRLVFTSGDAMCPDQTITVRANTYEQVGVLCSVA